ncbi:death-associated inhibitor of apoptosis 2-like [Dreissena polymorpha]|uniref:death-associated inhibitor of apoptosis 2-like n=1 Tax=Dreissena polymorpha TaxID=45954 RepID=UPI0022643C4F|nr:death-associated inhibitor of apoptosis 2-like [Dreissena polymorpha]
MDVCGNDVECDGMYGAGNIRGKLNSLQTGVIVAPADIAKVVSQLDTKAVQPSSDDDNTASPNVCATSQRTLSKNYVTQHHSPTAQQQTQLLTNRPETNTYSQTFKNGSSAMLTHFQTANNGSPPTPINTSGPTGPKYPHFSTVPQRLKSFGATILAVSTKLLSVAGFFLVRNGGEDATRCHHCGIGLRHWSPEDDPWVEHARFSPKCEYLLSVKGHEFVNLIQLAVKYSSDKTNGTANQLGNTSSTNSYKSSLEPKVAKTRQDLMRENSELHSIMKCMYCTSKEVSIVFLPCGHLISCDGCGKEQRMCKICGSSIKGTVRTYMA